MKKKCLLFTGIVFIFLLLTACENIDDSLKAKASDFEGSGFRNDNYNQFIVLVEDGILISSNRLILPHLKTEETEMSSIDEVVERENAESGTSDFFKIYPEGKIETKGSKYYVTLDENISLEFEKIALRKIKDSKGVEFVTQKYPE